MNLNSLDIVLFVARFIKKTCLVYKYVLVLFFRILDFRFWVIFISLLKTNRQNNLNEILSGDVFLKNSSLIFISLFDFAIAIRKFFLDPIVSILAFLTLLCLEINETSAIFM